MAEVYIQVAIRIRPLLPKEVLHQHQVCVRVIPGTSEVMLGSDRIFPFDHAFGPATTQDELYESCVEPLLETLIHGHNATVFCYGQTGSGKTYTMGGKNQEEDGGIIDRVAEDLFSLLENEKKKDCTEVTVQVSYLEVYKEELRDLLELQTNNKELRIREDEKGNTVVVGAKQIVISSAEELLGVLEMGNALRHSGATGMNEHSSRSHAILTVQLSMCHKGSGSFKSSKLCLVDLAGSERAGKSLSRGTQLRECAHINTGLLALSNVIRALSDSCRARPGNASSVKKHIPYRDAKITRLLRDSLGGTAHTVMVACVNPSLHFVNETLNVLQFASRVRQIHNDPEGASAHTDEKTAPPAWHPEQARVTELEQELQTLRQFLKEKSKDSDTENGKAKEENEGDSTSQPSPAQTSEPEEKMLQQNECRYRALVQEAAALLADISGPSPSVSFNKQLKDWQEKFAAVGRPQQTVTGCSESDKDQGPQENNIQEEVCKCQDTFCQKGLLLEQKEAELKHTQSEYQKLLQERRACFRALEDEQKRNKVQTEQLVCQQTLINRLRCNSLNAEIAGRLDKRPSSVPVAGTNDGALTCGKVHPHQTSRAVERALKAIQIRSQLLWARQDEKQISEDESPENEDKDSDYVNFKEELKKIFESRRDSKTSLNQTWTSTQSRFAFRGLSYKRTAASDEKPVEPRSRAEKKQRRSVEIKARRANSKDRRIHDLTVNMRMKLELLEELDKTERETQAATLRSKDGSESGEGDALVRLSMQSQEMRDEVIHSLRRMQNQKLRLQYNYSDTGDQKVTDSEEQIAENSAAKNDDTPTDTTTETALSTWFEKEENMVFKARLEMELLRNEKKSREEVLKSREAILEHKKNMEEKVLRSSQTEFAELHHVSRELDHIELRLKSTSMEDKEVAKIMSSEEMKKRIEMLRTRKGVLEVQLRTEGILSDEETEELYQIKEQIESLDSVLLSKNRSIKEKEELLTKTFFLDELEKAEPARHCCDLLIRLERHSFAEITDTLIKYFNKVIYLRESERRLKERCKELELHAGEQEAAINEMKSSLNLVTLYSDRKLTQQQKEYQNNIRLLLQNIKENAAEETQHAKEEKLHHLEKELFFYKSTTRQLKKKLKELLSDAKRPDHNEGKEIQNVEMEASGNDPQFNPAGSPSRTHVSTTYTKIFSEEADQIQCPSVSTEYQLHRMDEPCKQMPTEVQKSGAGHQSKDHLEMTPVQVCRRELRQIYPTDQQVACSAMMRKQSADPAADSMVADSIEVEQNKEP